MKKLFLLLLIFGAVSGFAQTIKVSGAAIAKGSHGVFQLVAVPCGTSLSDTSDCGPSAIAAVPCTGGATDITGLLPYTILAAGAYKITANAGVGASTDQIIFNNFIAGAVEICFENNALLTGIITYQGFSSGGLTLKNPRVTCLIATSGLGCLKVIIDGTTYTGPFTVIRADMVNTSTAAGNPTTFFFENGMGGYSAGSLPCKISYSSFTSGSDATSSRVAAVRYQTAGTFASSPSFRGCQWDHNKFIVSANANAGQGLETVAAQNHLVEYNYFDMTAAVAMAESARGVTFDGMNQQGTSKGNRADHNAFNMGDNRAGRARGSDVKWSYNITSECKNASSGCYHFGDMDSGNDWGNVEFGPGNQTPISTGNGVFIRAFAGPNDAGVSLHDNSWSLGTSGTSGHVLLLRDPTGTPSGTKTIACAKNNTVAPTIGSASACAAGTGTNSCADTGSTLNITASGTASGAGTIGACP